MSIVFPGETMAPERGINATTDVLINNNMTMLSNILDVNGAKKILITEASTGKDVIGIGYFAT